MARRSYSFVCTSHDGIIVIMQTWVKALDMWNVYRVYFAQCVSKIMSILSIMF